MVKPGVLTGNVPGVELSVYFHEPQLRVSWPERRDLDSNSRKAGVGNCGSADSSWAGG